MSLDSTLIFHITQKDNLRKIVDSGGLIAQSQIQAQQVQYCNIAHSSIQDRRSHTPVPCGPEGYLHDYVPFYFAPRSPMLYAIHMGNVDGCTAGQGDIIYLVTTAQKIASANHPYVFTDGHGIMAMSDFYEDLRYLDEVDWQVMKAKYWNDTNTDPDRKRRRQAEFLVFQKLPWAMIEEITTIDEKMRSHVQGIMSKSKHQPPIKVRSNWYY